jgi:hypothetical protein
MSETYGGEQGSGDSPQQGASGIGQAFPHCPQLLPSFSRFTHFPAQHEPLSQTSPAQHAPPSIPHGGPLDELAEEADPLLEAESLPEADPFPDPLPVDDPPTDPDARVDPPPEEPTMPDDDPDALGPLLAPLSA